MTPLTNQKLVEALKKARQHVEGDWRRAEGKRYKEFVEERLEQIDSALKEASAPKEFAGLSKQEWRDIELLLQMHGDLNKEAAACRQIADGLSE